MHKLIHAQRHNILIKYYFKYIFMKCIQNNIYMPNFNMIEELHDRTIIWNQACSIMFTRLNLSPYGKGG